MSLSFFFLSYILAGTPYVRHKGYVRIHLFIRIVQVILWYLYIHTYLVPLHTLYTGTYRYIVRGTSWYQPVMPVPA